MLLIQSFYRYVCIAGVNRMTAAASSLTLNLILNLRKFTSLLVSILYFNNDFGVGAQIGTGLVILGTIVYTHAGILSSNKKREPATYTKRTVQSVTTNEDKRSS